MQRKAGEILHSGHLHEPVDQDVSGGGEKRGCFTSLSFKFGCYTRQLKHWAATLYGTIWKHVVAILFLRTSWCHWCLVWGHPDCSVVRQGERNWTAETLNQSRPLIPDLMDSHSCTLWPGRAELGWKHIFTLKDGKTITPRVCSLCYDPLW